MTTLEELIAKRDQLNREIDQIQSASAEYAPTTTVPYQNDYGISTITRSGLLNPQMLDNNRSVNINITIDNSTRTRTETTRRTDIDTNLAGGDSALGLLGGLLGKIFN